MEGITVEKIADSALALTNASGCRAYLVLGTSGAALVDTMDGVGDLAGCVGELVGERPLTVLLTHRHADHVAGAYLFGEVMMAAADDGDWDRIEEASEAYLADAVSRGLVTADGPPRACLHQGRPRGLCRCGRLRAHGPRVRLAPRLRRGVVGGPAPVLLRHRRRRQPRLPRGHHAPTPTALFSPF